ncbi:MAG: PRC-barrel domain-containing protein [Pseudomonadota bacterium]
MTLRKFALTASTILTVAATPLLADGHGVKFDPAKSLAAISADINVFNASVGSQVFTADGEFLGRVTEFVYDDEENPMLTVELDGEAPFTESTLIVMGDDEDIAIDGTDVTLNADSARLQVLRTDVGNDGTGDTARVQF